MMNEPQEIALHKKRFGQYFSGKKVADLLFSLLPEGLDWQTVVDPMAGIGDMLVSAAAHTQGRAKMLGVEIDEAVAKQCKDRLPEATIRCEDAFVNPELITQNGWDLVITNPPYVRYQLQVKDESVMPSSQAIRDNLIKQIKAIPYFSSTERDLFFSLAKNYSGLADMAVPAWILCAALVKKGGYLAIVVPETWLNRNYASPIQYLLNKCFEIETIARDANWFPDALVKTCLVVAKRQEISPLETLADQVTQIVESDRTYSRKTLSLFPHMLGGKDTRKWVLDEDKEFVGHGNELPHELLNLIGDEDACEYISLSDMGVDCGQGLRTGANDFFYLSIVRDDRDQYLARSKGWDQGGREYRVQKSELIPALQNRREIEGLVVVPEKLTTGVIYLSHEAEDDFKEYIDSAEQHRDTKGRKFKDYSAVKSNEKRDGEQIVRYWYMLPKFARRHLPNLCLTRVSSKLPECLYVEQNVEKPIAIDANMVTLWSDDQRINLITFAMLNSTWSKLYLELICTVMGGGALKIEASHLKKLLLPKLAEERLVQLEKAGAQIINAGKGTQEIQDLIDKIMFSPFEDEMIIEKARELLTQKLNERSTKS